MRRRPAPNLLIPPTRMRALYRALLEARLLGGSNEPSALPSLGEAPYAATLLALSARDLVSIAGDPRFAAHLRSAGLRRFAGPPSRRAIRRLRMESPAPASDVTEAERMLLAIGAAQALRRREPQAVVLFFVGRPGASQGRTGALPPLELQPFRRAIELAERQQLPVVFVSPAGIVPGQRVPRGLPVIPVDGADPLALHRVAQETIARARAGDGPSAIDCDGSDSDDPMRRLRAQMIASAHATPSWFRFIERDLLHRIRASGRVSTRPSADTL